MLKLLNKHVCYAEYLISLAECIKYPKGVLMTSQPDMDDWMLSQCRLAMEFDRRPISFKFRAVFEEWSQTELTREMY